ncbi:hypothetical protein VP01_2962g2 [Puccinia sorghi]|uniref:Uncharacterized protein n=1 Tax=Puccinia sorghi TaxID=27349 RepID=A0A0L6V1L4_9BASI|nr:hypothetical protein VP01_2962g2 [Puccinia sorghi]
MRIGVECFSSKEMPRLETSSRITPEPDQQKSLRELLYSNNLSLFNIKEGPPHQIQPFPTELGSVQIYQLVVGRVKVLEHHQEESVTISNSSSSSSETNTHVCCRTVECYLKKLNLKLVVNDVESGKISIMRTILAGKHSIIIQWYTAKNLAQLPAVDMQKVPGSFCCYSKLFPRVVQPSFDAKSLCRLHSDCAKTSTYANRWSLDDSLAGECCMSTAGRGGNNSPLDWMIVIHETLTRYNVREAHPLDLQASLPQSIHIFLLRLANLRYDFSLVVPVKCETHKHDFKHILDIHPCTMVITSSFHCSISYHNPPLKSASQLAKTIDLRQRCLTYSSGCSFLCHSLHSCETQVCLHFAHSTSLTSMTLAAWAADVGTLSWPQPGPPASVRGLLELFPNEQQCVKCKGSREWRYYVVNFRKWGLKGEGARAPGIKGNHIFMEGEKDGERNHQRQ